MSGTFYLFQVGTVQPLEFTNNKISFRSSCSKMIVFGNWERFCGATIFATNNLYINETPTETFIALVGTIWSANSDIASMGSIYVSRST